jgi:hypothetical protein
MTAKQTRTRDWKEIRRFRALELKNEGCPHEELADGTRRSPIISQAGRLKTTNPSSNSIHPPITNAIIGKIFRRIFGARSGVTKDVMKVERCVRVLSFPADLTLALEHGENDCHLD